MPQAEISWVVERRSSEILRDNPLLDRLIEVDTKALRRGLMSGETLRAPRQQLRRLRASAFDVALDFQGLLKSASIARLSGARRVFGYSRAGLREPASALLLSKTVAVPASDPRYSKVCFCFKGALGIPEPEELSFPIHVNEEHEAEAREAAAHTGGKYAILNPGGGWPTKLWSVERFGKLADLLWSNYGIHSLVTYGPGELELAEAVRQSSVSGQAQPVSLSLKGFYSLARAHAFTSAAIRVRRTSQWLRVRRSSDCSDRRSGGATAVPRPEDICVERNDIDCRVDCHRRSCSKWICMDIEVGRVMQFAVDRTI
jgi:ADP-heptose:LPS heptosyltransferase